MKQQYWEKIAPSYSDEIFDVLQNDHKGIIRKAIQKLSSPKKTVIDVGTAIGKWLPVLSPAFKKVYAVDISRKNLAIAAKHYASLKNVVYRQVDMSSKKNTTPPCDVAVCINAILTSSLNDRQVFFNSLNASLKINGMLVLVVPSLESWLLTHIISNQFNVEKELIHKKTTSKKALKKWKNILQGNADIDDVPTKHYLEPELELLLNLHGFTIEDIIKVEYEWKTEFNKPPKWLENPKPWDWLVTGRKVKSEIRK